MQSGKVRYNSREDTLLSLPVPMEVVLNKGERIWHAKRSLRAKGGLVGEDWAQRKLREDATLLCFLGG